MKIAVIGGTGRIGSQVVEILNASGHEAVPHSPSTGLDLLSGQGLPGALDGADVVVNPLDFAGLLLATTHGGQHIADYLADLASMKGKVRMIEREVRPEEVGKALRDISAGLGLRIIRDGTPYGFWRPQVASLEAGDLIMEICPTCE